MGQVDGRLDSRGAVLLRWREANGLKQASIARALPIPGADSTISQWESGRSAGGPSQPQVEALDARFAAAGCIADMYAAVQTPAGLDADQDWFHNFQGTSGPCWGWVRTSEAMTVTGFMDAGPFRLDLEVPPADGVFIQAYGFASNPAVHVRLDAPGWVDFGRGKIPAGLGVPIVDAVDFAIMGPGADPRPGVVFGCPRRPQTTFRSIGGLVRRAQVHVRSTRRGGQTNPDAHAEGTVWKQY